MHAENQKNSRVRNVTVISSDA